ncbi:MAG: adenylate cyclase, partial [Silicimonas sp.]|nr:adenylate cyclase [Silicimonas sp.]
MSRKSAEIAPKSHEIIQLGDFRFFVKSRELQDSAGSTVTLRSQSADVLAYLAMHAGVLVSKDALIAAVWGDTFVTNDSLVQCIGDIRRALGDENHEIVQTSPRKGYK